MNLDNLNLALPNILPKNAYSFATVSKETIISFSKTAAFELGINKERRFFFVHIPEEDCIELVNAPYGHHLAYQAAQYGLNRNYHTYKMSMGQALRQKGYKSGLRLRLEPSYRGYKLIPEYKDK